jgi:uncharacterized protein (DUF305 family)
MIRFVALLATVLLAGACSTSDHNDADVAFATDMIEHHAQAIQMANYTIGRDGVDPRIAELAEEIRVSQTHEIDTMSGWLRAWDEPVPETGFATGDSHSHAEDSGGSMGSPDGAHADMPGMMAAEDMQALADAPAEKFDAMWLQMMVEHHRGAIRMAQMVQDDGKAEDVAHLAAHIETVQRGEVKNLRRWLGAA